MVPRDARAQPARAAHDQGVVQRGRRRPRRHPAARRRRDAALLHERRGAGGQAARTSRSASPTSTSSRNGRDRRSAKLRTDESDMTSAAWVQGARPRTLGAAVAPVLVGTAARCADADGVIWWRVRGRDGRRARAAGRRQLRQRLLRRRARHRHGPQGPAAADRDRPASPGAVQARRVRSRSGSRRSSGSCSRSSSTRGCCSSASPRSPPPCSTPAVRTPYGYLGPRRGHGARVLRLRRHASAPRTCRSSTCPAPRGGARSSSGCSACAILLANNVRDIPTDRGHRQAHARGARRRDRGASRCSSPATSVRSSPSSPSASRNPGPCSACSRSRSRSRRCARSSPAPIRRRSSRCSSRRRSSRSVVAVLVSVGLCLS